MAGETRGAHGPGSRGHRLVRRSSGTFLLALFVLANPAYFCPINCLLHGHWLRADQASAVGDMCHSGPAVTAQMPPGDRELSPAVPHLVQPLSLITREVRLAATGAVTLSASSRPAPPPPPPRS